MVSTEQQHTMFYSCTDYAANCTDCAQLHVKGPSADHAPS